QSVQQFAHQRDDRLQPGLAAPDQPLDKAGGRRAAPRRGQRRVEESLAQPLVAALGEPRPARQADARGFLADVEPGLGHPLTGGKTASSPTTKTAALAAKPGALSVRATNRASSGSLAACASAAATSSSISA